MARFDFVSCVRRGMDVHRWWKAASAADWTGGRGRNHFSFKASPVARLELTYLLHRYPQSLSAVPTDRQCTFPPMLQAMPRIPVVDLTIQL